MRSPSSAASARLLRAEERELIAALIASAATSQGLASSLEDRLVKEMDDGGRGSLSFADDISLARRFGAVLAEGTFPDEDGALVSVALYVDEAGELLEPDVRRVDFSPLKRWPRVADVEFMAWGSGPR